MLIPPPHFKGWKVWTVGDDIAWMKPGADGRLYAINPEAGYFGVVPGTNYQVQPQRDGIHEARHHLHQRRAHARPGCLVGRQGRPAAEGMPGLAGQHNGRPDSKEKAAHPNSRFRRADDQQPDARAGSQRPDGVPISAIIFGGRRADTMPLVYQAFNWIHGVYVGATMGSETTAAAAGTVGQVRRDPMAMLPFCGYNMGDYFQHWIHMRKLIKYPPRIFHVNWFRQGRQGRIPLARLRRKHARAEMDRGPLQRPGQRQRNAARLGARARPVSTSAAWTSFTPERLEQAQTINYEDWRRELLQQDELFMKLYSHLPKELIFQRELLVARL